MNQIKSSHEFVTDAQWARIKVVLEQPSSISRQPGRPRADDRQCLEGIVRRILSPNPWTRRRRLETSAAACYKRLQEWEDKGQWRPIWRAYVMAMNIQQVQAVITAVLCGNMVPAWPRQLPKSVWHPRSLSDIDVRNLLSGASNVCIR